MGVKILVLLCLSILAVVPAMAQTKSVTNADLEKFRQKRLQAEKDYRENYARLGFPSPEELDRQIEKSRVEREELVAGLAAERLRQEQLEAARADAARYSEQRGYFNSPVTSPGYYYGYPNTIYFGRSFQHRGRNYNYPISLGNGFPIGNYGYPTIRPFRTSSRWLRP